MKVEWKKVYQGEFVPLDSKNGFLYWRNDKIEVEIHKKTNGFSWKAHHCASHAELGYGVVKTVEEAKQALLPIMKKSSTI